MTVQYVDLSTVSGQTLTAKVFPEGSDTEVVGNTLLVEENDNDKGTYRVSITRTAVLVGTYKITYFNGTAPFASGLRVFVGTDTELAKTIEQTLLSTAGGVSEEDIQAIATAVKQLPNVNSGSNRLAAEFVRGDTWSQAYMVGAGTYTELVWSLKRNKFDSDDDALLTVSSVSGVTRVNASAPVTGQADKGTLTYSSGTVTLTVDESISVLLPTGDFFDGIKTLPANRHLRNALPAKVVDGLIQRIV